MVARLPGASESAVRASGYPPPLARSGKPAGMKLCNIKSFET
uniref:Uncharacterized protein n=1 Tax=Branchiostoma lanceolatum TaxID=7740 RepID=Q95ZU6_BRALA|nr:unknown [Branchiostoma lanceolatum]